MRAVALAISICVLLAGGAEASTADPQAPLAPVKPPSSSAPPEPDLPDDGAHARVVLRCIVMVDATVDKCEVAHETPAGHGLGEAALRMSREIKLSPDTFRRDMVGQEVDIPLNFARDEQAGDMPTMP